MPQIYKKKNNNLKKKTIVFSNGLGMDQNVITHMKKTENTDIIEINSWHKNPSIIYSSNHEEKYLIAWSMGIWASEFIFRDTEFKKKIAINGTPIGINNKFGINERIFLATLKNMNEENKKIFLKNMILEEENVFLSSEITYEELKEELKYWWDRKDIYKELIQWDTAIIGTHDRIFNPKNQFDYWQRRNVTIKELNCGHYIFNILDDWNKIIEM